MGSMTGDSSRTILQGALRRLLRPLVRLCISHSLPIQDFIESAKICFADLAKEELDKSQGEITDSRISIITGLHRRDVKRLRLDDVKLGKNTALLTKVVGQWLSDPKFTTKSGTPRVLSLGGDSSDFSELVRKVNKNLNPATILFELERVGTVARGPRGLQLKKETFIPVGDTQEELAILAMDNEDLFNAALENIFQEQEIPNLHRRTEYDNVRPEVAEELQRWLLKEGLQLHKRAREYISQFDQDIQPIENYSKKGIRVVLGTFGKIYKGNGS